MEATLNVRMNAALKERGDKVLRENGISASYAARALWLELATTRTLPSFLQGAGAQSALAEEKRRALNALVGVAGGALSDMTDAEIEAVKMERYE